MILEVLTMAHPSMVRLGGFLDAHPCVAALAVVALIALGGLLEGSL